MVNTKNFDDYLSSLEFKLKYAQYHFETAITNRDNNIALSAEFTAMMSTLHTCLDIIAQCINAKTSQLHPRKISFNNWLLKPFNKIKDDDLRNKIIMLSELEETKYLHGYVNISKHRNIITIDEQFYFLSAAMPVSELVVEEFIYNEQGYSEKPLEHVMDFAHSTIQAQINDILKSMKKLWKEDGSSS